MRGTPLSGLSGLGLAALLALLFGCSQPAQGPALLDDYLQRLSRTLDAEAPDATSLWAPPRLRDAGIAPLEIPRAKLDVLDFLALSGCELQVNLGRRNSSLGRNAAASQVLLLDLEFLALAPACVNALRSAGNEQLALQIQAAQAMKIRFLPHRIFNALLAGPEYEQFWKLPGALAAYPETVGGAVIDSLHWFDRAIQMWLSGDYRFQVDQLEDQLFHLRNGDGGALLLAATLQARTLDRGNALLAHRLERGPLCPGTSATATATTLKTVVSKFFAGGVQPWLAQLDLRDRELLPPIRGIEAQLAPVLPDAFQRWSKQREATLTTLRSMPRTHIAALQALAASCPGGLLGGAPQT